MLLSSITFLHLVFVFISCNDGAMVGSLKLVKGRGDMHRHGPVLLSYVTFLRSVCLSFP